ncbi:MAG: UDP-N-acetyl-D-glucosamine dehydrogenase, partial [candidate division NC10 bacterium]|nr:UDP-N-acetyl-D-glucosamine dehydrogenase [candidate division NC10 bacterium]
MPLPMAVAFAESGLRTVALDIDHERVDQLRRGLSYIPDVSSDAVATQVREGRLTPGTDEAVLDGMYAA